MNNWSQRKGKIITLTKQGINCWLAYALSQPIDVDIKFFVFLIKEYLGISTFKTEITENSYFFSVSVSEEEKEKSFEKIVA